MTSKCLKQRVDEVHKKFTPKRLLVFIDYFKGIEVSYRVYFLSGIDLLDFNICTMLSDEALLKCADNDEYSEAYESASMLLFSKRIRNVYQHYDF